MVFQKRLNYGSSGDQVAAMPHFPRSAKGKRSVRRKAEDNQMCAFDLLVTVAGQLLEGGDLGTHFITTGASSPTSAKQSVKQEQSHTVKPVKIEAIEDGSFLKERSPARLTVSGHASLFTNSDASDKDGRRNDAGISHGPIVPNCSLEGCSKGPKKSSECKVEDGINLEDPIDVDTKPLAWLSSDSSVEFPLHGVRIARSGSFDERRIGMKLPMSRDDDERSSSATHPSTSKAFKPHRIGDRRIRKLLASKYWKVAPTMFKDAEVSDTERKLVLRSRKLCYTRPRTQRCLFKRRKLSERNNVGLCGEGKSNSPMNGSTKVEPNISLSELNEATGAFSSISVKDPSYDSGDFQVKFTIKSFKVPELFIEMPKTATVGSLKRTVMDAVTAALGGSLHVGVYLQGKKVRDDNKTLLEAGISHADELDNLGFTLEPSRNKAPAPLTPPHEEPRFLLPCDSTLTLTSIPAYLEASNRPMPEPSPLPNCPESDHDSVQSPTDGSSRALVPVTVPTARVEPLAVVPLIRKAKRSDLIQRRIRRPFSVSEVEALVQAVEKLGTGRWRDVKIGAFDSAKHRTYVDLKDKWKTLVHTATISPQQRRGEPVPQELLDRVLAAHAYWTENQAKVQVKPPTSTGEPMLLI